MFDRYVNKSKFVRKELDKISRAINKTGGFQSIKLILKKHRLVNYSCG